jgi:hypothetical protein
MEHVREQGHPRQDDYATLYACELDGLYHKIHDWQYWNPRRIKIAFRQEKFLASLLGGSLPSELTMAHLSTGNRPNSADRLLKSGATSCDPVLRGYYKCTAHPACGGTALSKTPRALADGLMLVFQHAVKTPKREVCK